MEKCAECVSIQVNQFDSIADFLAENKIDLLVVGPEQPLVEGLVDQLRVDDRLGDLSIIGPAQAGAMLEGSKAFAKDFMAKYKVPTAACFKVDESNIDDGKAFIRKQRLPIVLKADGLAAGKGVLIIDEYNAAEKALVEMLEGQFGSASAQVVIEEFLDGIEFSVFVLTDGKDYVILPEAKDYKRIGEGDKGLNTGGMGAISPVPFCDKALMQKVEEQVVIPTIEGIRNENFDYHGFVYIGLMKVGDEPYVVEYNVRLGDPETQVVLARIKNDLAELLYKAGKGQIAEVAYETDTAHVATVVLASGGYPQAYEKGKLMSGLESLAKGESFVFCAGVKNNGGDMVTNGGRVCAVNGKGADLKAALKASYDRIDQIEFEGMYYRKDIGFEFQ